MFFFPPPLFSGFYLSPPYGVAYSLYIHKNIKKRLSPAMIVIMAGLCLFMCKALILVFLSLITSYPS